MNIPTRAAQFTTAALRNGVTDEDGEPMTEAEAERAIQAVAEKIADEEGRFPNLDREDVWSEVEALVLDRFGADPDAFTPERN